MAKSKLPSPVVRDDEGIEFFSSGCTLLDAALGGGWAVGRVSNILGESASGKSLLGIEAAANFMMAYPTGRIVHIDTEAAFDPEYAETLGLNTEAIDLYEDFSTVEQVASMFDAMLAEREGETDLQPCLIILDSIDALTTNAEVARSMEDGTFGVEKAKLLSQLFRRYIRRLNACGITLMIMSQVRANLNAGPFGKQTITSGGKALKFYVSQQVELQHMKQIKKTVSGNERVVGVMSKATIVKNRMGPAHRKIEFPIMFGYGVHDEAASLQFIVKSGKGKELGIADTLAAATTFLKKVDGSTPEERKVHIDKIREVAVQVYKDIEESFAPARAKYGVDA
jgi:recombination protein RecA